MLRNSIFLIIACIGNCPIQAQTESETSEAEFHRHHNLGIVLSHAHVFQGHNKDGDKEILSLPAWSFDYNFIFHPRWAVGVQADLIVEKFVVEKFDEETIERSFPFAPAIMATYKPTEHWAFKLGAGAEFASGESFFLNRAEVEYGTHFGNHGWEVFGTLGYDLKWNVYDTWLLGLGIGKVFGFHHKS